MKLVRLSLLILVALVAVSMPALADGGAPADPISDLIAKHAGLAMAIGFVIFLGKDFVRDWLARDGAAKLSDADPKNDALGRLEQSAAQTIDKVPNPFRK